MLVIDEKDQHAIAALIAAARGVYDARERFHLNDEVVRAFVRGALVDDADATPADVVRLAGKVGIPTSVLVRVGRGEPAAAPLARKPSAWAGRPRLAPPG